MTRLLVLLGLVGVLVGCESSSSWDPAEPARLALASEPRFKHVTLVAGPLQTYALEGLVDTETDALDARTVVFKAFAKSETKFSGVFNALLSKQPGMSRLGRPWAAMAGSADDWERLTQRKAAEQVKDEWWR